MPDTNHFTGLPVPIDGEAADGPAAFAAFRAALGGHTVLSATTSSNRDSLYADAPIGSLCASTISNTAWLKTGTPNVWSVVYSDTGWLTFASSSFSANFTDNGSAYRVQNGRVAIDLRSVYQGDPVGGGGGSGNISNTPIITLPSNLLPGGTGAAHVPFTLEYGAGTYGFGSVFKSSGNVSVAQINPLAALNTGVAVYAYIQFMGV